MNVWALCGLGACSAVLVAIGLRITAGDDEPSKPAKQSPAATKTDSELVREVQSLRRDVAVLRQAVRQVELEPSVSPAVTAVSAPAQEPLPSEEETRAKEEEWKRVLDAALVNRGLEKVVVDDVRTRALQAVRDANIAVDVTDVSCSDELCVVRFEDELSATDRAEAFSSLIMKAPFATRGRLFMPGGEETDTSVYFTVNGAQFPRLE